MNGTSGEELRRTCQQLLHGLGVPVVPPFRMAEFCAALAVRRGRPIVVQPVTVGGEGHACGLWVATGTADVILVEKAATPGHQDHIIAHELGHMAFDHYGNLEPGPGALADWLPNLSPALIERVLGRNAYSAREELEAEVF